MGPLRFLPQSVKPAIRHVPTYLALPPDLGSNTYLYLSTNTNTNRYLYFYLNRADEKYLYLYLYSNKVFE